MSSKDHQLQTIVRYSRKTYKDERNSSAPNDFDIPLESAELPSPSKGGYRQDPGEEETNGLVCDIDITNLLHQKCPVINLAQQQMRRLLDETDRILSDGALNNGCYGEVINVIRHLLKKQNTCYCILVVLIATAFFVGLLLGGASCGTWLRQFNSPILTCINDMFVPDSYKSVEDSYRSVV